MAESLSNMVVGSTEEWVDGLHRWLETRHFGGDLSDFTGVILVIGGTVAAALLSHLITRSVLVRLIHHVVSRTPTKWDDFLVKRRFFYRAAHLVPAVVLYLLSPLFTPPFFSWSWETLVQRGAFGYMTVVGVLLATAGLSALADIYGTLEASRKNPISGFVQGAQLLVWLFGGIFLIATVTGRDPWGMVAGLGAVTAVILLVFKDSILGLVASIQILANDMVHIGDWIEMPKYGADGDVIDITLTTIKVRNWDKTITTVPTYALISDSFKNWRGMQEAGGRRIKRSLYIDMTTIKFCTPEMLDRFEKVELLRDYLCERQQEIDEFNRELEVDPSDFVNGRHMTNIGTFRAYVRNYLRRHSCLHRNMTLLVRQLAPTEKGLPIEIYAFSSEIAWADYENIQADIFDHLLAVLPEFELGLFQYPTGSDFREGWSMTSAAEAC